MARITSSDSECAEARVCPHCDCLDLVGPGEMLWPAKWTCPSCLEPIPSRYGIPQYAPALGDTLTGFDPADFEKLALQEEGHFWFEPRNRLLVGLAERYSGSARRYLEIGCGTGFVLGAFASSRSWSRLVGSEIHPAGILMAQKRLGPKAEFVQMDARSIPARCAFDLVGAFDVLEHIADDKAVIRAVHSALRPGGSFITAVPQHPFLWSDVDERSYHVRRYFTGELEGKLRAAEFKIIFSTSYLVVLLPLLAASRLMEHWRSSATRQSGAAVEQFNLPQTLNAALRLLLNIEVALTLKGLRWPIGGSRIVVAQRLP